MTVATGGPSSSATPMLEAGSLDEVLAEVLDGRLVVPVYQSVVDLGTGDVVGYEALARGPQGPLHQPRALFSAARRAGRLIELDAVCRTAAVRGVDAAGIDAPSTLFINVEPEILDREDPTTLLEASRIGRTGDLPVVLEITERALATRPAELLRTVERARELGWRIALDDVGVDRSSLTFVSLLSPDLVKLDLSLVQQRADAKIGEVMHAIAAYVQETGAVVIAEGIETEQHRDVALSLGATLGQGWLFSHPTDQVDPSAARRPLVLPARTVGPVAPSPFAALPPGTVLKRAPKRLLVELSRHLEEQAAHSGRTAVLAASFQHARYFTPATARRYGRLSSLIGFVAALGGDMPVQPAPGVRGSMLADDDPVLGEWDVIVAGPDTHVALLAHDLGDDGPEMTRRFEYALTFDPQVVRAALQAVVSRIDPVSDVPTGLEVEPAPLSGAPVDVSLVAASVVAGAAALTGAHPGAFATMARRALAATTSGVTIADVSTPDHPLVYANAAFEVLSGLGQADLLGRDCRFLQGPDTDRAAVARIGAAIAAGQEVHETLLNYRVDGRGRKPWWNELVLSPVRDDDGTVVQYVGVQNDVTSRVLAELKVRSEQERTEQLHHQLRSLAYTDALTGLANRRAIEDRVEAELAATGGRHRAAGPGHALGLLFLDLDQFKPVNDEHGHAAGDELLRIIGLRLRSAVAATDSVARLGGDEFLIAIGGLDPARARAQMASIAMRIEHAVRQPVDLGTHSVVVTTSTGFSLAPQDGTTFGDLMHLADLRMYAAKRPAGRVEER